MTPAKARRKQWGFSLVELMVGMVLGIVLIAGAVSVYIATKQSYTEVERVAALTENARFAEQILRDSLRHAGFFGEVRADNVEPAEGLSPVARDCSGSGADEFAQAYNLNQFVYAKTATTSSLFGCIDDVLPDTDVLVIKRVLSQPYTDGPRESFDPNDPTHRDGTIDTPHLLSGTKTYIMTNNVTGLLFDGSDIAPSIRPGGAVPNGTAWEYQYEVFYVRDADIPQLSRKTLVWNGVAMEVQEEGDDIAEGVENLRVLLGYDSNGDGEVDTYEVASQITTKARWGDVESVEVFMLVRSATEDTQYTDVKTYQLPGDDVGPKNDGFHRLISHASVSLRNLKLVIRGDA